MIETALKIIGWIVGMFFSKSQANADAQSLGAAKNELEHLKQEAKDREALQNVAPRSPDDAIDSLRRGEF